MNGRDRAKPAAPRVEIRIDRLVVEGPSADPRHAARIEAAMIQELSRLLSTGSRLPLAGGGAVPLVRGPMLPMTQPASPGEFGRQIARSLHAVLTVSS
jgi:hypothetical protein